MAGISIDFIDDDEFLELERCIASAERKYQSRTDQRVEAHQAVIGFAGPSVKRPAVNSPASLQQQAEHHVSTKKAASKPAVRLFQQLQVHQQVTWQADPAASACPAGISTLQTAAVRGPSPEQAPHQAGHSIDLPGIAPHRNAGQQLQEQSETSVLQQQLPLQSQQLGRLDNPAIVQTRPQHYAQPGTDTHSYQQHADGCSKPQQIAQHQQQHPWQTVPQQWGHEAHLQQQRDLDKPLPQCKQQYTPCLQLQPPSGSAAWQHLHANHPHPHQQQQQACNQWSRQLPAKPPGTADQQQGLQHLDASHLHAPHEQVQEAAQPSCNGPATMCQVIPQLALPRTASAPAVSGSCNTAAGGHSWGTAAISGQGQGAGSATTGMASGNASGGGASGRQRSHSQPVIGCHTRPMGDGHAVAAGSGSGATWVVKQHVQHPVAHHHHQQVAPPQQQHTHHPSAQQQRQQHLVPHQQQQVALQQQQHAHHPLAQQHCQQQHLVPHQQQQQQQHLVPYQQQQQQHLVPHQQQQQQVQHPQLQQHQSQPPRQQQRPPGVKQELQASAPELNTVSSNRTHISGENSSCTGDKQPGLSATVAPAVALCTAAAPAGGNDTAALPDTSTAAGAAVSATSNGSGGLSGRRKLPPSFQGSKGLSGTRRQQPGQDVPSQQHQHQQQQVVPHGKPQKQLDFQGVVRYAYNPMEVDWLCRQMLDAGPPKIIGLDIEWRPTFKTGQAPNRTALLQIAYAVDKEGRDWRPKIHGKGVWVLLLHVYYTGITPALQEILQHDEIIKVGVNISGDVCKLLADFKVEVCGTEELSDAAHGRQLRCVDGITANTECKRWSLAGLVEEVLGLELPKPNGIRLGNWEQRPLSDEQKQYAALDAFASLLLHWELQALPERLTLSQQLRAAMRERAEAAIAAADDG